MLPIARSAAWSAFGPPNAFDRALEKASPVLCLVGATCAAQVGPKGDDPG